MENPTFDWYCPSGMKVRMGTNEMSSQKAHNLRPPVHVIPQPVSIVQTGSDFLVDAGTMILIDDGDAGQQALAATLAEMIERASGFRLNVRRVSALPPLDNMIVLTMQAPDSPPHDESYALTVTPEAVILRARTLHGLFYGIQTIRQLLPLDIDGSNGAGVPEECCIPGVTIDDWPRYPYRGMHLDVCRHFFPVEFVKKYIDLLASFKMNMFHWHFTEDQGWRIEIKKYPKLTEIGAWRSSIDGSRYGGFYTQNEIRSVVDYAARRFVTVIPEIELPGHARAALAAYPEYSCTGGPFEVAAEWGVFEDVYCPGREETFVFLEDILDEVAGLFPSPYIHIGGDECPKTRWKAHDLCRRRIRAEGLADEHELQSYFIKRIEKILNVRGKQLIGWDEILEGGLAAGATVMSWRGMDGGIAAARAGHNVIMSPTSHCYFDYYQADPETEPKAFNGLITIEQVYSFDPTPAVLTEEEARHILGAQGNVWTEYISTPEHAEYMAVPRMLALAEVVWSPKSSRNWDDFRRRLEFTYRDLDLRGVHYHRNVPSEK